MEWVAHRAGNEAALLAPAAARADAIELDVHLFRGRLEVRHGKVLWPFARLWERWELLPSDAPRPVLREILDAAPPGVHLWFDLKGFTPRLTRRVLRELGDRRPATLSTRSWWILRPARRAGGVRTMRSVGSRWQRRLITRVRFSGTDDGIVINQVLLEHGVLEQLLGRASTVIAWGVRDAERARDLARLGISGLIVDDLGLVDTIRPPGA